MRNFKYFSPIEQDRVRVADRLRFLFHGRAYKRRFAARAAEHGIVFSSPQPPHRFLFAATSFAMLAAVLSVVAWLGGQLHEARMRNQAMAAELRGLRQRSGQPQAAQPLPQTALPQTALSQTAGESTPRAPDVRAADVRAADVRAPDVRAPDVLMVRENRDEGAVQERRALEQARAALERAQAGSRDLSEQLQRNREQLDSLRSEIAGSKNVETRLYDQLRESELRLSGITAELTRLQTGRSADTELIAAQRFNLRELNERLNAATDTLDRERKLLVADHDIRELMGARSLHISDVYDVDGNSKTQRSFGRIFYTEGKSLIFYAFDLKAGATFQAWGQREARDESAQSLGIFYVDDKKQNRWVLKFDNPKVLAEINAVFVTIEPPGGSAKPNRQKKMMYADLNATPNHP